VRFLNTNPNQINLGRNLMEETFGYARVETDGEGNAYIANPALRCPASAVPT
jgi:hypothetical protein